ncbi:pVI [Guinea pig adenovirus 1]|uniref:PVI n=1 Tax=Guinea pig adenovirus 1 TaxID=2847100 RepID=A0AC61M022_9ADEN|nr:pVI [Guinea pig adenovirus]QIZ64161.1 pVI [Guinea pig adenovirus 1]QIZ64193.1 pVI [Guinea pig adenovirus]
MNFASLAPRVGERAILSHSYYLGDTGLHGGALSWGSLWTGLKSFGSRVSNWGSQLWNSRGVHLLRQRLDETGVGDKIIDGVTAGIHGALDIARQHMDQAVADRLTPPAGVPAAAVPAAAAASETLPSAPADVTTAAAANLASQRVPPVVSSLPAQTVEVAGPAPVKEPPPPYVEKEESADDGRWRERVTTVVEPPPSYASLYGANSKTPLNVSTAPVVQPAVAPLPPSEPAAADVVVPATTAAAPVVVTRPGGSRKRYRGTRWQTTLNDIVGLGFHIDKRRRCY